MKPEQDVSRGKPASYGQEILRRRKRIVGTLIDLHDRRVLDFGCGNGAQTVEFANDVREIIACDIDRVDLEVFREFIHTNHTENITAVQYDGSSLPIQDASVDIVLSFAVLEHVQNEHDALEEIKRVLKDDGQFIISVPNKWWIFETHGANLPLLPWNRVPFFSWLPKGIHGRFAKARIYRRNDIVHLLDRHGFHVTRVIQMTAPMDVVRWPLLQRTLRRSVFRGDTTRLPFIATEIFVACQKSSS